MRAYALPTGSQHAMFGPRPRSRIVKHWQSNTDKVTHADVEEIWCKKQRDSYIYYKRLITTRRVAQDARLARMST